MLTPQTLILNRYLIIQSVGQGGMGAVYQATDQRLGGLVALKEMQVSGPQLEKAFEREAKLLANLRHSALPRVIDYFNDNGSHFLVMDYIPGANLAEQLVQHKRPFLITQVLIWADQMVNAIEYLHNQQPPIIHRDIKPQNLKVNSNGEIILLDFGLAKGMAPFQSRITTEGSVFGYTPEYAPLEQIQGRGTDPRSDLYALGATLYHLLAGSPPPDALLRATDVLNNQPDPLQPIHTLNPQVPIAMSALLLRAMALGSNERPGSISEFRAELHKGRSSTQTTVIHSEYSESKVPNLAGPVTQPTARTFFRRSWLIPTIIGVVTLMIVAIALAINSSRGQSEAAALGALPTQFATGMVPSLQPTVLPTAHAVVVGTVPIASTPTTQPTATTVAPTASATTLVATPATPSVSATSSPIPSQTLTSTPVIKPSAKPTARPTTKPTRTQVAAVQPTADSRPIMPSFKGWNYVDAAKQLQALTGQAPLLKERQHSEMGDAFDDYLANEVIETAPKAAERINSGEQVVVIYRANHDNLRRDNGGGYPSP